MENLSKEDHDAIQQPLAKDGWSNDKFDELYSKKTKNPFHGTERDRKFKKPSFGYSEEYEQGWDRIFGNRNTI